MPRPQFRLKTLLWLMLCVACFLGGMAFQRRLDKPVYAELDASKVLIIPGSPSKTMTMPDGSHWLRIKESD